MTPHRMIEIGTPDKRLVQSLLNKLVPMETLGMTVRGLYRAFAEGAVQSRTIRTGGEDRYVIFYSLTFDGAFLVQGAVACAGQGDNWPVLVEGGEMLARELGAKCVLFLTSRAGLAAKAKLAGYSPTHVVFSKKI